MFVCVLIINLHNKYLEIMVVYITDMLHECKLYVCTMKNGEYSCRTVDTYLCIEYTLCLLINKVIALEVTAE